jgi:predicted enzyme related to lactoylglutathione lyase
VEVATSDAVASKHFYGSLLGWKPEDVPAGDMGTYTLMKYKGKEAAGLYALNPEQRKQGVPPHWMSYIAVKSADASAKKATELGGKVLAGPMDVMDLGRMAVIQDPGGAVFSLWQAKKPGSSVVAEPGFFCWNELQTNDTAAAAKFYSGLFGWQTREQDLPTKYTMFMEGEQPKGGMFKIAPEMGPVPANWMVYITVDDCDPRVAEARRLGAKVLMPPMDVPNVGRMAALQDPQGAVFSVIKLVNLA